MNRKFNILGVNFNAFSFEEAQSVLIEWLEGNENRSVYTPNPEIVMAACKDAEFMDMLNSADLVLPDGVGIVWASKFTEHRIRERVPGYDTVLGLFGKIKDTGKTVYFYGGAKAVALEAADKMRAAYPGLRIIGVRDGFIKEAEQQEMLAEIHRLAPDILLVGTGSPRQERFIARHKVNLPCKLCIGVGGSFDGFSGRVRRAPRIFIKLKLEWLFRLLRQPTRFKRQLKLVKFVIAVYKDKSKRKREVKLYGKNIQKA
ncbi:MAG: WecB/TagA/CpsF family glycosyltransferase [Defluviitaleaceae bacterium]|nr:WecB/TagA/CpsF family glycosyltransferase [Defluviitaleaceae bacterium]